MAAYSIDELLKIVLQWEVDLHQFYTLIEERFEDPETKHVVALLKEGQDKAVEILQTIQMDNEEHVEFEKGLPNYQSAHVFKDMTLNEDAKANEILTKVLSFEEDLLKMYQHIQNIVVYEKSKDIFDMLVQYKLGQIKKMNQYFQF